MITRILIIFIVLVMQPVHANDKQKTFSNIGFEESPPAAWIKKFPICDKFLKVKWIDKQKRIGYSMYDVYQNGNKAGQMTALIYLNKYFPQFGYDAYQYVAQNQLEQLFEYIRNGKIVGNDERLQIDYKGRILTFWSTIPLNPVVATLAENTKNVCVVYPQEDFAWISEGKKTGKVYSENEFKQKLITIKKYFPGMTKENFERYSLLDLNHDGIDDYVSRGMIYSVKDKYLSRKRKKSTFKGSRKYVEYIFPHNNKSCVNIGFSNYIVTDGINYIWSNKCNLSELTKE